MESEVHKMKVEDLMRAPYYVDKNIGLKEVAKIMSSKNIGSLIFMPSRKIEGILTERDLLKNYEKNSKLKDVMSENVIVISPGSDINEAMRLMKENSIKKLPVVDNEKLVGIITLTDIAAHLDELEEEFFFE